MIVLKTETGAFESAIGKTTEMHNIHIGQVSVVVMLDLESSEELLLGSRERETHHQVLDSMRTAFCVFCPDEQ